MILRQSCIDLTIIQLKKIVKKHIPACIYEFMNLAKK